MSTVREQVLRKWFDWRHIPKELMGNFDMSILWSSYSTYLLTQIEKGKKRWGRWGTVTLPPPLLMWSFSLAPTESYFIILLSDSLVIRHIKSRVLIILNPDSDSDSRSSDLVKKKKSTLIGLKSDYSTHMIHSFYKSSSSTQKEVRLTLIWKEKKNSVTQVEAEETAIRFLFFVQVSWTWHVISFVFGEFNNLRWCWSLRGSLFGKVNVHLTSPANPPKQTIPF